MEVLFNLGYGKIVEDLEDLQAATPKLRDLPRPSLDVDAWVRFAMRKGAWRALLATWQSSLSPVGSQATRVECSVCGKNVPSQGRGSHMASARHHFRLARHYCDADGKCPPCGEMCPLSGAVNSSYSLLSPGVPPSPQRWALCTLERGPCRHP